MKYESIDPERTENDDKDISLSPFGKTTPQSLKRLESAPKDRVDPETIMMRLWEKENVRRPSLNFGMVPLDCILHECTPECGKKRFSFYPGCDDLHRYSKNLSDREVEIVASTLQYLATNCGRGFYENFQRKLKEEWQKSRDKAVGASNVLSQ